MKRAWQRLTGAGLLSGLLVALTGCPLFSFQEYQRNIPVSTSLTSQVLARTATPIGGMAVAPDGRIFFTEKNTGALRVIVDDQLVSGAVAVVPVNSAGGRGLLGVAVHPQIEQNGRVYVFYARSDTGQNTADPQAILDNRVVYFTVSRDLAISNEIFVAALPAFGTRQVGGRLAFDGNRRLLVGVGDNEDTDAAQDFGLLNGKILRYNDDGTLPEDNPVPDSPVFALGVRDPRGFARDPLSGVMYFVDRSPGNRSEVNRLELAGNFGWADAFGLSGTPPFVDPIFDSRGSAPAWSGIGFNLGLQFGPSQLNTLVIGESAHRQLRLLTLDATLQSVTDDRVLATGLPGDVVDVAFSPSGALYVACTNAILRIVPYP